MTNVVSFWEQSRDVWFDFQATPAWFWKHDRVQPFQCSRPWVGFFALQSVFHAGWSDIFILHEMSLWSTARKLDFLLPKALRSGMLSGSDDIVADAPALMYGKRKCYRWSSIKKIKESDNLRQAHGQLDPVLDALISDRMLKRGSIVLCPSHPSTNCISVRSSIFMTDPL